MKNLSILLILTAFVMIIPSCKQDSEKKETGPVLTEEEKRVNELKAKTVLTVNDNKFSNLDLQSFIKLSYPGISDTQHSDSFRSRIFDKFVDNKLVMYKVKQQQVKVDQEEINEYLREHDIPMEKADNGNIVDNVKVQKYLFFRVYKNIDVSGDEIRKYYNGNQQKFKKGEEIKLYQIMVKNRDRAGQIWGRLKNSPQKFEEIARTESDSVEGKNNGFMGYFEKGALPKEMEEVVFSLRLNTISPVTQSPYGFHIFKVTQKRRRRTLYLSNVREQIKQELLSKKLDQAYLEFLHNLKKELSIQVNHQNLFFKYKSLAGESNDEK